MVLEDKQQLQKLVIILICLFLGSTYSYFFGSMLVGKIMATVYYVMFILMAWKFVYTRILLVIVLLMLIGELLKNNPLTEFHNW